MIIASKPDGDGDARDSKKRNGVHKVIKSGRQSGVALQLDKHPVKPIELAAITEKDNGRMNGDKCLQAFNAYMFRVETKPYSKRA
jgi:hypothetical protein